MVILILLNVLIILLMCDLVDTIILIVTRI